MRARALKERQSTRHCLCKYGYFRPPACTRRCLPITLVSHFAGASSASRNCTRLNDDLNAAHSARLTSAADDGGDQATPQELATRARGVKVALSLDDYRGADGSSRERDALARRHAHSRRVKTAAGACSGE